MIRSFRKHVFLELPHVVSWWIVLGDNEVLSVFGRGNSESDPFRALPYDLGKMSSSTCELALVEVIVFDFVVPGLGGGSVLVVSWG